MGPTGEIFTRSAVADFPEYSARKPAGAAKKERAPRTSRRPPGRATTGRPNIFNLGN